MSVLWGLCPSLCPSIHEMIKIECCSYCCLSPSKVYKFLERRKNTYVSSIIYMAEDAVYAHQLLHQINWIRGRDWGWVSWETGLCPGKLMGQHGGDHSEVKGRQLGRGKELKNVLWGHNKGFSQCQGGPELSQWRRRGFVPPHLPVITYRLPAPLLLGSV